MFNLFQKQRNSVAGRTAALNGCPIRLPIVGKKKKGNRLLVTVEMCRPTWQQFLGADKVCEKTYGLDEYGEEVYSYCCGGTDVKKMAEKFSAKHHISLPEAEISVATFLRILMEKGLIGIEIEKEVLKEVKRK